MNLNLNVLSINVGIQNNKEGEEQRKLTVQECAFLKTKEDAKRIFYVKKIANERPDVVCLQEQIKKDATQINNMIGKVSTDLEHEYTPFYLEYGSQKEAAVLVKNSLVDQRFQIWFDPLETAQCLEIQSRLLLVKLKLINFGEPILIGSWHGPHKSKDKDARLRSMLEIVRRNATGYPFFIAGDFNLHYDKLPSLPEGCHAVTAGIKNIDYFIFGCCGMSKEINPNVDLFSDKFKTPIDKGLFKTDKFNAFLQVTESSYPDPEAAKLFLDHIPQHASLGILPKPSPILNLPIFGINTGLLIVAVYIIVLILAIAIVASSVMQSSFHSNNQLEDLLRYRNPYWQMLNPAFLY